jgi:hypothetical protein
MRGLTKGLLSLTWDPKYPGITFMREPGREVNAHAGIRRSENSNHVAEIVI